MTNIAINGIGRIGKFVLKLLISNNYENETFEYYEDVDLTNKIDKFTVKKNTTILSFFKIVSIYGIK